MVCVLTVCFSQFKNMYDNDITVRLSNMSKESAKQSKFFFFLFFSFFLFVQTWSPQGRLHQVEYSMEAVKQGSACVGAKSKTHACVAGIMRTPHEMSSCQPKVFKIDAHMGIAIAGLTADARYLTKVTRKKIGFYVFEKKTLVSL